MGLLVQTGPTGTLSAKGLHDAVFQLTGWDFRQCRCILPLRPFQSARWVQVHSRQSWSLRRERLSPCQALWDRNREPSNNPDREKEPELSWLPRPPKRTPRKPRQPFPSLDPNLEQDSPYPPETSARPNSDGRRPPPNRPPPPDSPFEDDTPFRRRGRRPPYGEEKLVSNEELYEQSKRIRQRIREIKRQRRDAYYGEVGEGLSWIRNGLNPEMINGRCAMVGFVVAMGMEISTGKSVWEQLTTRGGLQVVLIPLVIVVIMLSSYAPGANEMEEDGLTRPSKPFGPFNSFAERVNGRFAMIGFLSLIIIEAFTGEALFKIG